MSDETLGHTVHTTSGDSVQITRRVEAPEKFRHQIIVSDTIELPAEVILECSWNEQARKYDIENLLLKPLPEGPPISGQLIRQLPIGALVEKASKSHLILHARVRTPRGVMSTTRATSDAHEMRDELIAAGPRSPNTLEWVAVIYELASIEGGKPTRAVSELLGISLRTASNWVKAARASGTLDDG